MDQTLSAVLRSWSFSLAICCGLGVTAAVYLRGWFRLRRRGAREFGAQRLSCFLAALTIVYVALRSPLDTLAPLLLQAHMIQHLLLMLVVSPLVWLAAPEMPLLAGLPEAVRRGWVVPLLRLPPLKRAMSWLVRPVQAWTLGVGCLWLWHVPAMYELALRNRAAHDLEHLSFLVTSLVFWWPVLTPYPRRRPFSPWLLLPYLFLAGVQGTLLSGVITFADRVIYPHYEFVPRLGGISALTDQEIAGALMWVVGSLAYLIPLVVLGSRLLYGDLDRRNVRAARRPREVGRPPDAARSGRNAAPQRTPKASRLLVPLPVLGVADRHAGCERRGCTGSPARFDALRIPVVGRLLRARHTRTVCQSALLLAALLMILDGLLGPQVAPLNLAGVLPWIHWRGLLMLSLLAAGNFFCMACPFTLPRRLAAGWLPAGWQWPRALRNKWAAVVLCVLFFWSYERFALWDSPWWTAWLIVGYFLAALAVDGLFHGTPFCKYVCPIGQFNFVQSLVSPLQVSVVRPAVCLECSTHACIRGGSGIAGCETGLFQPQKRGNLDCTFCLDCVRSCPHDNVGLLAVLPAAELSVDPRRSGIGRLSRRADLAALVAVLAAAAFVNAAWMTAPLAACQPWADKTFGPGGSEWLVDIGSLLGLVALPAMLVLATAWLSSKAAREAGGWRANAGRYVFALVPVSSGMWGAHYAFHLLSSAGTIAVAAARFAADLGLRAQSALHWSCPCCGGAVAPWLLPLEIVLLDLGLVFSLYVAYTVARREHGRSLLALRACGPWVLLVLAMFVVGVVILLLPMQMRGTLAVAYGGAP